MSERKTLRGDRCLWRACGLYFTTTSTFDKHRVGRMDNRRCRCAQELTDAGWSQNKHGFWMRPAKASNPGACDSRRGANGEPLP